MGKYELAIEYVKPTALKPYKKNARKHGDEDVSAIMQSILDFGFNDPIGVWGESNTIVEGHGRLIAAQKLGMESVPIIHLDHLNDEQRRAYGLAHNRTAELSEWDEAVKEAELKAIESYDMSEYGFAAGSILDFDEKEDEEDGYYGDERERTYDAYNLHEYDPNRTSGFYDIPIARRCDYIPTSLIGFNYVLSTDNRESGVHFFLDDYQFERIWVSPQLYIEKMKEFPCALTPDFSLYMDMPLAMKIWNVYRSRLVGQIMYDAGIQVIPTLQWAGPDTYGFTFDGIEGGGTVAVSTVGVMRNKEATKAWKAGMEKALEYVRPKTVVCYGTETDFNFGDVDVVTIKQREFT